MNNIQNIVEIAEKVHTALYTAIEDEMDNYNVPEDYPQLYSMLGAAGELADVAEKYLDRIKDAMYLHDEG